MWCWGCSCILLWTIRKLNVSNLQCGKMTDSNSILGDYINSPRWGWRLIYLKYLHTVLIIFLCRISLICNLYEWSHNKRHRYGSMEIIDRKAARSALTPVGQNLCHQHNYKKKICLLNNINLRDYTNDFISTNNPMNIIKFFV